MRVPELGGFRLGEWSVHQIEGTLCSGDTSVRLEPRVMDVLFYLAAHPGRVVSKEELLEAVWRGSFVEEGALAQAIHSLRKALGDEARQPRYIQTIPKRGYRLISPVLAEQEAGEREASKSPPLSLPKPVAEVRRRARLSWLLLLGVAIIMAVLTFVLVWGQRSVDNPEPPAAEHGMRIAILPFENLGKPGDAFFAEGLTEEITKDLASFPSLQVISRTSAIHYKGLRKPLPEIGRELRVDYILEGTVRWAAGPDGQARVRITPQLIRVADDSHLWADAYDREVEDIFEVQAEISRHVIGRLGITLMPGERRALSAPPTENLEAYRAYIRGLDLKNQPFYSDQHLQMAVPMFERAVELDPSFAVAWAELSQTHSYLAFNTDSSPGRVEKARRALDRAAALDPDLQAVRLARAYFTYRCLDDYAAAYQQLNVAARLSPNDAEILQTLGFVLRRLGRLAEAADTLQRAFSLDPHTVKLVWAIAETYRALRNFEQADHYYAQAISLAPDQPVYWEERALNRLAWTGDVEEARRILAEAPAPEQTGLMPVAFQLDLYERRYEEALARLSPERMRELTLLEQSRLTMLAAIIRSRLGDRRGAIATAKANRATLGERVTQFPKEAFFRAYLAVALAQLGRGGEALAQAEQAVHQKRNDAFTGPRIVEIQAAVDALLGRRQKALERLARLMPIPYQSPICGVDLRLSPVWDPLREDLAFAVLLRRFGG